MTITLKEYKTRIAKLEREEVKLRGRLKKIQIQRDRMHSERRNNVELVEEDEGQSEDEFDDAISESYSSDEDHDITAPLQSQDEQEHSSHLPDELILQITSYVARGARSQQALATCCLLSRAWYSAAVPLLYRRPRLYGQNFDPFVRSICPSINIHVRKSPLADFVRVLDMSQLVHQGSKSVTARLLGRTKEKLEEFVAPQASFSLHAFPALAKCARLEMLDLSLVSDSPPLPDLFKSISHLARLSTLRLPRSTGFGVHHKKAAFVNGWPPNITDLTLSGGIDAHFLHGVASFPPDLEHLTIEHCPLAKSHAITHLLRTAVQPLEKLQSIKIAHMPRLSAHALDSILFILPQISKLSVSVDYITPALFDENHYLHPQSSKTSTTEYGPRALQHFNLRTLELTNSNANSRTDSATEDKITPEDVHLAMLEGCLLNLRQVRVAQSLKWHCFTELAAETEALTDELQEAAKRDWEGRTWVFAEMRENEYARERCWERVSGVWVFDG